MHEAVLRSNNGGGALHLRLTPAAYGDEPGFDAEVRLEYGHWDGDHEHGGDARLPRLWLAAQSLRELRQALLDYADAPLAQLAATRLTGTFELAGLPGERLGLRFGPREDLVPTPLPVLTLALQASSFSAGLHFITDQSCLRLFAQALGAALRL